MTPSVSGRRYGPIACAGEAAWTGEFSPADQAILFRGEIA
jgi:hypothetical protein